MRGALITEHDQSALNRHDLLLSRKAVGRQASRPCHAELEHQKRGQLAQLFRNSNPNSQGVQRWQLRSRARGTVNCG